jgi:hypothetical protein
MEQAPLFQAVGQGSGPDAPRHGSLDACSFDPPDVVVRGGALARDANDVRWGWHRGSFGIVVTGVIGLRL